MPGWQERYRDKLVSVEAALQVIQPDDTVVIGMNGNFRQPSARRSGRAYRSGHTCASSGLLPAALPFSCTRCGSAVHRA